LGFAGALQTVTYGFHTPADEDIQHGKTALSVVQT